MSVDAYRAYEQNLSAVTPTSAGVVLPSTRLVLVTFAVLTLLATNQLVVLAAHTEHYFAWTIAEPTAAFLGASYAAGFVLAILALRQDRWVRIRVALVTVAAFTVLTLFPTLNHLHVFHLMSDGLAARFAAWFWLGVYLTVPIACLLVIRQQRSTQESSDPAPARRPMPRWLTALLAGQGLVLLAAGAALYSRGANVHHHSMTTDLVFWPWPVGPLGAQVVGAWLIAFGIAAGLAIWERDLDRLFVPAAAYAAFGGFQLLVTLRYWAEIRPDDHLLWAYVSMLCLMILTGVYGCWAARAGSR
jgi:hypothetical protein